MKDITDWFLEAHSSQLNDLKEFSESLIVSFLDGKIGEFKSYEVKDKFIFPDENVNRARQGKYFSYHDLQDNSTSFYQNLVSTLELRFGKLRNTACIYYPVNGFMGWHTNSENVGDRVYISYTREKGESTFSYHDGTRIVRTFDHKGFTVRHFQVDDTNLFWHRVDSKTPRLSLGFQPITS